MADVRFNTARELFEAFPTAADDIKTPPADQPPHDFVRTILDSVRPQDAIAFCAYLLPRREAVWWSCRCLRALRDSLSPEEEESLVSAEAWVKEPEDHRRREALRVGMSNDRNDPATWAALAAAWSGGSLHDGEHMVPAPPHLTAQAARVAVLGALSGFPKAERSQKMADCLKEGLRLVGLDLAGVS